MKMLNRITAATVAFCAFGAFAATEASSGSAFLHLDTAPGPFWRTATNSTVEISVDYPAEATSASLSVKGAWGYSFEAENVAEGLYVLELPAATDPRSEDVYDLTLSFDKGETRTARFAVICGVSDGGRGSTRCITPQTSFRWRRIRQRSVVPVPYLAQLLDADGETVETGLNGAAGWYACGPVAAGERRTLSLNTDSDGVFTAELEGAGDGAKLFLR